MVTNRAKRLTWNPTLGWNSLVHTFLDLTSRFIFNKIKVHIFFQTALQFCKKKENCSKLLAKVISVRNHPFNAYVKFPEKLSFLPLCHIENGWFVVFLQAFFMVYCLLWLNWFEVGFCIDHPLSRSEKGVANKMKGGILYSKTG